MKLRAQRGFTLIELMIALVVSSLLVGMILAIFSRMSIAYRGQQQIAGLQQVLAAARATIETDAKQAGYGMPQGFRFAADPNDATEAPGTRPRMRWPVRIINNAAGTGPDQIAFFYGDASSQGVVVSGTLATSLQVTMDPLGGPFAAGDRVLLSTPDFLTTNGAGANLTKSEACALEVLAFTAGSPATVTFSTATPFGRVGQTHCVGPTPNVTMLYKLAARGYRIEPQSLGRPADGPLQLSTTGGLVGTAAGDAWSDIAFGFTDIQTALRVFDGASALGSSDFDGDGIANKEWLSGAEQTTVTDRTIKLDFPSGALLMTITLVARTDRDVEGVGTSSTPVLTDTTKPSNKNAIGDRASVDLTITTDPALVPTNKTVGSRIFRYVQFQVDFRNLGVGK